VQRGWLPHPHRNKASDLTASDDVHLTEKGSEFLVEAVIDRILGSPRGPAARVSQ
jgi:hypothetical protein